MSENQKDFIPEEQDDFSSSTIFSAPSEHKDKKKAGKYSLALRLVAIFLVVALLGGSVWWVTKYIAEKTAKEGGTFQPEQMSILGTTSFKKLTVIHDTATLVLNSSMQEESGQQKQVWTLEGYDETLIDKTSLSQIATYASAVTVFGEYDYDEKTQKAQFGLDKPVVTVKVEANDAKQSFVLTQGNVTADGAFTHGGASVAYDTLFAAYENKLESVFPARAREASGKIEAYSYEAKEILRDFYLKID